MSYKLPTSPPAVSKKKKIINLKRFKRRSTLNNITVSDKFLILFDRFLFYFSFRVHGEKRRSLEISANDEKLESFGFAFNEYNRRRIVRRPFSHSNPSLLFERNVI